MKWEKIIGMVTLAFPITVFGACPTPQEASEIITRVTKTPIAVVKVTPIEQFNACQVETESGDTFFISKDKNWIIEGILVKVPKVKLSSKDYIKLKERALFSIGKGEPLIVLTNPLCRACKENREKLKELSKSFKLFFVPVGFEREELKAAVDAYCRRRDFNNFFDLKGGFKICEWGKLKVWSNADILKRYGITATPVFIFKDGEAAIGIGGLISKIEREPF